MVVGHAALPRKAASPQRRKTEAASSAGRKTARGSTTTQPRPAEQGEPECKGCCLPLLGPPSAKQANKLYTHTWALREFHMWSAKPPRSPHTYVCRQSRGRKPLQAWSSCRLFVGPASLAFQWFDLLARRTASLTSLRRGPPKYVA